jgi:Ca2+-binding RTX toxin-like protein
VPLFPNTSLAELDLMTVAAVASYPGAPLPAGYTVFTTEQLGIPFQFWEGSGYYENSGANAVLLRNGDTWIISFRSKDDQNDFDQLDPATWLTLFRPFLDAVVAAIPNGDEIYVTGASLGGAAANMLAEIAATEYPELTAAKYFGFAPLFVSEKEGIFNFGFENDPYYKSQNGYSDFNSSMDNLVAATAEYMAGDYDGQQPFNIYAHWGFDIRWFENSIFLDEMNPDSVVFVCAYSGMIQDITPGRENTGVFYLGGNNADTVVGRNGNDFLEGFGGADKLSGGAGDDTFSGGQSDDFIDGQSGHDVAYFSGLSWQYTIQRLSYSEYSVVGPDGVDTIAHIEQLQFADTVITNPTYDTDLQGAGLATYFAMYGVAADTSTQNNHTSSTEDNLTNFADLQHTYGSSIGVADPMLYTWEALGQALCEAAPAFDYLADQPTTADFVAQAYAEAFGHGPGQAQIEHFVDQVEYFESIYADSGAYGSAARIELLARGAVYGQMLGISAELELL